MKKLVKAVVICLVFFLAAGIIPAWDVISEGPNMVQAGSLEEAIGVPGSDTMPGNNSIKLSTIKEIVSEFKAVPVGEMFFYLGRPYLPFVNWSWLLAGNIMTIALFFLLSVLAHALFPAQVKVVGQAIKSKTGVVIGRGLIATLLIVPVMLALAITIIGIPLVLLVIGIAGIFGCTSIALIVGEKLLNGDNPLAALALGVLIVGAMTMIPILGGLLSLALFIIALGAVLTTRFGTISQQS